MWLSFIEKKSTFHHHLCAVLLFLPSSYTFLIFFAWMQINWILAFRDNVDEILFLCPPCLSRLFHLPLFFPPSLPVFLFFICPPSSSPLFLLSFFFYQQFILDRKKNNKEGEKGVLFSAWFLSEEVQSEGSTAEESLWISCEFAVIA